jgi:ADP-heptose:LPS heptosyltransferase
MGDVLMTGPALRALRGAAPGRRVTLLTSEPGAGVAALMPEVD